MTKTIEGAFRAAATSIEHLVRTIVREELQKHRGPEGDHLMNVRSAPMSARKLRALIRSGDRRGFRHGRETFVSAVEFRAFVEGRPVVREEIVDTSKDAYDEVLVTIGRAALRRAEVERVRLGQKFRDAEARRERREAKKCGRATR